MLDQVAAAKQITMYTPDLKQLPGVIAAAVILTACSATIIPEPDLTSLFQQTQIKRAYAEAEQLLERDKPVEAANALWAAADKLPAPHRQAMQIRSAEILLDYSRPLNAFRYLTQIDETPLHETPEQEATLLRKRIADAKFYDETNQYRKVISALPDALMEKADKATRLTGLTLTSRALSNIGDLIKGIKTYLALNSLLDESARPDNILQLWQLLAVTDPQQIVETLTKDHPEEIQSWLRLAALATPNHTDIPKLLKQFEDWKSRHQNWTLPDSLREDLILRWEYLDFSPGKIALLLPLTGTYAKYGKAIRDGFMNAHRTTTPEFTVQFYNTDTDLSISDVYRKALAENADLVIGPLLKENVDEIVQTEEPAVPIITLNYAAPASRHGEIFQFGLRPEDEAVQLADKMHEDEHPFIIILTPDSEWGERLSDAFLRRYLELGGKVRQIVRYDPSFVDYTIILEDVLRLDESVERHRQISRIIGHRPEFDPRIRDDVSAAVLFADSKRAAMVYPQMKYHYADKLPVYTTSHVYKPTESNGKRNRDLDGLIYCDAPIVINVPENTSRAVNPGPYPRLFALGMDSHRLISRFRLMSIARVTLQGLTGELSVAPSRQLFRKLQWAKFRRGKPVPLQRTRI